MLTFTIKGSSFSRPWQLLLIYNIYRLLCLLFFLSYYFFSKPLLNFSSLLYFPIAIVYGVLGLFFFYLWKKGSLDFDKQVLLSGTIDIIFIVVLLSFIGDMRSVFVILLNVNVAALSILLPGRLAIFFAAIASCMLLGVSFFEYAYGDAHPETFYSSGMQGASIFATALTAWFLAHRLNISENIAYLRSNELANMQRINEYIVERQHSGVLYVDLNRQVKLINTAAKNFFNVKSNQKFEKLAQFSLLLDEKCQRFIDKIPHSSKSVQAIIEEPYLRAHFFSVALDTNTAVLIFLDDMSAVAQQAQQLKLASLGRFSASIAHELRNPLGAISHAVQLMGETKPLHKEDARLKQLITNNCNRMNTVIKNILQLSRREQSHPEVIHFSSFIKQFKYEFCIYNPCDIIVDSIEANATFIFDKSQLEQILVILCDNSIKHGRNAHGEVTINISIKQDYPNTEIRVCDQGQGVADSIRYDIFEPFFSTIRSGFGMGLFIAKDLCEINQARLSLLPSEQGACFAITLKQTSEILL